MHSKFNTKPVSTLRRLLSNIKRDEDSSRATNVVNFVMCKTRIRFPRSRGLHDLNRLFWHSTDWDWIFGRHNLDYSLLTYNSSNEPPWLHVKADFDHRDVTVRSLTQSHPRFARLPYITHTWTLHVLRAGHILAGNPRNTRLVFQGSILVIEWGHPMSPTATGPNSSTAMEFLRRLPSFTARVMVRGSISFTPPRAQYLILALETSSFVLH
ncbi:hypothetical protein OC846_006806 [Tilletia horrida]|uniref:Uncharacterized protein n=1 Tax=Tilletia horrida TaxID=155126 RepID=A0AAN6GKX3_9BASI|nr:hypothetical protein OC846_006806 [Tilletia horrida]